MRSSSFHTLLSSLLVLLLLSACNFSENETEILKTNNGPAVSDVLASDSAHTFSNEPEVSIPAHLSLAASYIGTQELTGQNDGPEVEQFLASVGLAKGNPYCAAFVSYILEETPDIKLPTVRSGLAYHFITDQSIDAKQVLRGTVDIEPGTILIWRKGNTIYGHAAFVEEQTDTNGFLTIEANTSGGTYGNQRDGDGVWRRQRSIQPGNYFRITDLTSVVYHS